ncbi:MAG: AAA family ATPase [Azonexus sp.]
MTEKRNSGEAPETSPLQGTPKDKGTTKGSVGNLVGTGFDKWMAAQQPAAFCRQQYEGQQPIIAPAAQQPGTFASMQAAKRWLVWNQDKKPFYANGTPRNGTLDSPADRAAWASYDEAIAAVASSGGRFVGIGFALGQDDAGGFWQGIDLDKIPDNQLASLANSAPGYVECSPSGKGIHAIGYGRHFATLGSNGSGIEAYSGGRYFTVTENMIRDVPLTCIADFVATQVAPRHSRTNAAQVQVDAGTVQVEAKTITELRSALMHMRSDDRDLWVAMGHALKELGDTGRGLWMEWSATSDKFDPKDAAKKWDSFRPNHTGYQAVFAEAQRRSWLNPNSNSARAPISRPIDNARRFTLLSDGDLQRLPPQQWLVKRIIPDSGVGVIFGNSGTFKSFLTLDLLAHVANGQEWFKHRVRKAPAVYIPFEGQGGIPKRVQAWRLAISGRAGCDVSTQIAFITDRMNLREAADRDTLVATLIETGLAGGVLCIDTLAQAGQGIEENTSEGMGEMISVFQELQQRLGGVVLVVHHSGKNASAGMRGWSGLWGALDFSIKCWRDDEWDPLDGQFVLDKVKDEESGKAYPFTMLRVPLGYDADGDEITSLTVIQSEEEANRPPVVPPDVAERHHVEEEFVLQWIKDAFAKGMRHSGRTLEGDREKMEAYLKFSQAQLRNAIARLELKVKIVKEGSGRNTWLRAVEGGIDA